MTDDSIRPHATLPTDKELVLKVIPMPEGSRYGLGCLSVYRPIQGWSSDAVT